MIKVSISTNFCFYLALYSYVEIDFDMQKTDKFTNNDMAVQSEIRTHIYQLLKCLRGKSWVWVLMVHTGLTAVHLLGLFIYYKYIYTYHLDLLCFSPLAEALQVRDDHVNPHVLLFAHVKLIPGKQMLVFLTGHRHLFFLI